MIFGRTDDAERYLGLDPALDIALRDLVSRRGGTEGPVVLSADVRADTAAFKTGEEEDALFEAHEKYADIHAVVSGEERVEIAAARGLTPVYSRPEDDFYALRGAAECSVTLTPGVFLLVFPGEGHRLRLAAGHPGRAVKTVYKIRIY